MPRFSIQTFGCQMNHSDSERICALLQNLGWEDATEDDADLVIFNTCSVRQRSEDKAVGAMRERKKKSPDCRVAVTGCMIRKTGSEKTSNDKVLQLDPVDFVFRIEDLGKVPKILDEFFPDAVPYVDEVENYFHVHPASRSKRQVFVPIMQGCNKFCTYCIVPHTRGREISRPMPEVVAECERLVREGAVEITLLGQNVNSYTHDGKKCFAELLRAIDPLYELGLRRVRFTSPHPEDFTDDVIDALATLRTSCPYIHLPAQHGSDRTLRAMARYNTAEQYEEIVKKLRDRIPGVSIVTDIIVGFPGETDEDFQLLLDFADRVQFDFSFTAIYSPRPGTPAAEMEDQISDEIKKLRFHAFDEVIEKHALARRKTFVGLDQDVLIESATKSPDGTWRCGGRSAEFFETYCTAGRDLTGEIVHVKITDADGYVLSGELV